MSPTNDVHRAPQQEAARKRALENEELLRARKSLETQVRSANAAETANQLSWVAIGISVLALVIAVAAFIWHR